MVWKEYTVKQFNLVDPSTTLENEFYGPYNTLLLDLFPPTEHYQVIPQFKRYTGGVDYAVSYVIFKEGTPIFFVDIRPFIDLNRNNTRAEADDHMRTIFLDFSAERLPSKFIGISAMGTRFAVYEFTPNDRRLKPPRIMDRRLEFPRIIDHRSYTLTDTAPKERWTDDIIEDSGEAKFKALVNEAKQVASALGVCEHNFLLYSCPFTD